MYGILTPAGKGLHITPGQKFALHLHPKKLIPTSHAQQSAYAGTGFSCDAEHEEQELPFHRETAA